MLNLSPKKSFQVNIFHSIADFQTKKKTIVTIGTFDGVHIGHQKILKKIALEAKQNNCNSTVFTFFPHPRMVLNGINDIKLLNTIDEKTKLIEKTNIENLIIHPFDKDFSRLSAEDFVKKILIDSLKTKKIVIGHDHRFGQNRSANIDDLIGFGKKFGFEVEQILAQQIGQIVVSSTKIRNAIQDGNMQLAKQFLGYNYFLSGKIVQGKQLGRTIGFATANLEILESYKLIPKDGVYVVQARIDNKNVFGMMNIGFNPTVYGERRTIETHFFDFNSDLYDQNIQIEMLSFIRETTKFSSIETLKNQLVLDQKFAQNFLYQKER